MKLILTWFCPSLDKIVTGSLNGVLRIYTPQPDGFKPEHLMLELQMSNSILQLATGKFVPYVLYHFCLPILQFLDLLNI